MPMTSVNDHDLASGPDVPLFLLTFSLAFFLGFACLCPSLSLNCGGYNFNGVNRKLSGCVEILKPVICSVQKLFQAQST